MLLFLVLLTGTLIHSWYFVLTVGAYNCSNFYPVTHTGWTSEDAPDEARLSDIGEGMSDRIFAVNGEFYTSQKGIDLYRTSGTARDW